MEQKYTFKVTVTVSDGSSRENILEDLKEWLEAYEGDSDFPGTSSCDKIEIV